MNGDGSVRIIYNGTEEQFDSSGEVNDTGINTQIGNSPWNDPNTSEYSDAKYVGYMYGGENGTASTMRHGTTSVAATYNETSTHIKKTLDNWYKANIVDKGHSELVVDNLFCNDRQLQNEVGGSSTGPGYGRQPTAYAAYYRHRNDNLLPTLKCGLKNDRFTVNDTHIGNGNLAYPVGLLTFDEALMGGFSRILNKREIYLYSGQDYWLFTPQFQYSYYKTRVYLIDVYGYIKYSEVDVQNGTRITLSLDSKIKVSGTGSSTDPFKVI